MRKVIECIKGSESIETNVWMHMHAHGFNYALPLGPGSYGGDRWLLITDFNDLHKGENKLLFRKKDSFPQPVRGPVVKKEF